MNHAGHRKASNLTEDLPMPDSNKTVGKLFLFCPLDWAQEDMNGERGMCECPYCHKEFKVWKVEEMRGHTSVMCSFCRVKFRMKHIASENSATILIKPIPE